MRKIFISHASEDSGLASRLCKDLRNAGQEVFIDLEELKLGSDFITFMNSALSEAEAVVFLHSAHTDDAVWQKRELNAAIWQEANQDGAQLIVLRLDESPLPPLLGPKLYAHLREENYQEVLERLCGDLLPADPATAKFQRAIQVGSENPFWRIRAEYYDENWPELLAQAFSPPGAAKMRLLEEMLPCFLTGSRGTGKTMLLLALRARTLASRKEARKKLDSIFGFYLRLDRGAFCNTGIRAASEGDYSQLQPQLLAQVAETFSQEFYVALLESLFAELLFCREHNLLDFSPVTEKNLVTSTSRVLFGPCRGHSCLEDLLQEFADAHRELSEFVRRKFIYREEPTAPLATLDLRAFKSAVNAVRSSIPQVKKAQFTVLLDEYENLFPFQKTVINSIVKLGPPHFSVKIARKEGTEHSSQTNLGQDLQETHDYNEIPLVYRVDDEEELQTYMELLESIVGRLLARDFAGLKSLAEFLPEAEESEVAEAALMEELSSLSRLSADEFDRLSVDALRELKVYYGEAARHRILLNRRGVRAQKRYSGAKALAFVSSGVIRFFQEILAMAFHLEKPDPEDPRLSPDHQSEAVHIVSSHNLAALGRNIELYGENLRYFLSDIADCVRHKLRRHSSEPEAGRLSIRDPDNLMTPEHVQLNTILQVGVREGVFQIPFGLSMRPKRRSEPQPAEFYITRIFAPVLQISARYRWKTSFWCRDLAGLLEPTTRRGSKQALMKRIVTEKADSRQQEIAWGGEE